MRSANSSKFSYGSQERERSHNENAILTNLMAELAIALNDKIKLEGENARLKLENEQNKKTISTLEKHMQEEKIKFNISLSELREQLCGKDLKTKENDVNHLEEVKTYLSQINDLKTEILQVKEENENKLLDLNDTNKNLENVIDSLKHDNESLIEKNRIFKEKSVKYRDKFKFSIGILQKMNHMLQYFYEKKVTANKKCQTEFHNIVHCEPLNSIHSWKQHFEQENILTELFFKPNPFNENLESLLYCKKD